MRIAIVGAGALGGVYAVHLSRVAKVTLVVRDLARAPKSFAVEKIIGGDRARLDAPTCSTTVPDDLDAILLCVRGDQVNDDLLRTLAAAHAAPSSIVVALTPLLPKTCARAAEVLGDRLVVGMPGVVAYEPDASTPSARSIRYWTPRVSPTELDERPKTDPHAETIEQLREVLVTSGLPASVRAHVATTNAATTIAFFPLLLGIQAAGGSMMTMIDDRKLLELSLDASKESRALSKTVGDLAGFSGLLLSFAGPFTVRAGIKLAKSRSPESITFLDRHFGTKLVDQNRVLFEEIVGLGRDRGVSMESLRKLAERAGVL
jgi:hypothetical protein